MKFTDLLRELLVERPKNRFFPAFILSSIAYHWKPLLIFFFGDDSYASRMGTIESEAYGLWSADYYLLDDSFFIPLALAIAYLFSADWIDHYIDKQQEKAKGVRKKFQRDTEENDLKEEANLLKARLENRKMEFETTHREEIRSQLEQITKEQLAGQVSEWLANNLETMVDLQDVTREVVGKDIPTLVKEEVGRISFQSPTQGRNTSGDSSRNNLVRLENISEEEDTWDDLYKALKSTEYARPDTLKHVFSVANYWLANGDLPSSEELYNVFELEIKKLIGALSNAERINETKRDLANVMRNFERMNRKG